MSTKGLNTNFFKEIDTSRKAYWLGFIFADGSVSYAPEQRYYELRIELKDDDIKILEDFKADLDDIPKIYSRQRTITFNGYTYTNKTASIRVYSKAMVSDLINIGIVPNKTYSEIFPRCDNYFDSFLRGFLDGDGCIYIKDNKITVHFTNPNKLFLEYIQKKIQQELNICGRIYTEKEYKHRLYYYIKNDALKLLDYIYQDKNLCLARKYEKYNSFIGSLI